MVLMRRNSNATPLALGKSHIRIAQFHPLLHSADQQRNHVKQHARREKQEETPFGEPWIRQRLFHHARQNFINRAAENHAGKTEQLPLRDPEAKPGEIQHAAVARTKFAEIQKADTTKLNVPNRMKQNGPPMQAQPAPRTVFQATRARASTGMSESNAANALTAGSHAGTGAPCGMPHHDPKKTSVKNANSV